MRGFALISRTLLSMSFRKGLAGRGGRARLTFVGSLICAALLSACIAVVLGLIGGILGEYDLVTEAVSIVFALDFVLTLIFGTVAIMSYLYFSRDSEFFLSLPVSANTVLFSKLFVIYVEEAIVSVVLSLPGAVVLGITASQSAPFYIMALVGAVFVPVCAILLGGIISVPLTYVAGFFRNRGAVASVLLIIVFVAFMSVYVVVANTFAYSSTDISDPEQAMEALRAGMRAGMYVIYPIYCLARFGTGRIGLTDSAAGSAAIDLAIFFGAVVALAAVLLPVSTLLYKRTVLHQSENSAGSGGSGKAGEYVGSGVFSALLKKEFRLLMRNASFAFQCLSGVIMAPVMCVLVAVIMHINPEIPDAGEYADIIYAILWPVTVFIAMMFVSMNMIALTSVTREGKTFIYSKLIPVPYAVQLSAKRWSALIPSFISSFASIVVATVVCAVMLKTVDILASLSGLLLLVSASLLSTEAFLLRDLKKPRLDWMTPREAVKGNPATIMPIVLCMLVSFVCGIALVLSGILPVVFDTGLGMLFNDLTSVAFSGIFIAFTFVAKARLNLNADIYYNRL